MNRSGIIQPHAHSDAQGVSRTASAKHRKLDSGMYSEGDSEIRLLFPMPADKNNASNLVAPGVMSDDAPPVASVAAFTMGDVINKNAAGVGQGGVATFDVRGDWIAFIRDDAPAGIGSQATSYFRLYNNQGRIPSTDWLPCTGRSLLDLFSPISPLAAQTEQFVSRNVMTVIPFVVEMPFDVLKVATGPGVTIQAIYGTGRCKIRAI